MNADKNILDVPEKYQKMLKGIVDMMEHEMGQMYQITVNKFGDYHNVKCVVGGFESRNNKVLVYDMDAEHKELEGTYNNLREVEDKIKYLRGSEFFYDIKEFVDNRPGGFTHSKFFIGKCKVCNSYNEDGSPNFISGCCQNRDCTSCMNMAFCKWDFMQVDKYKGNIYTSSGGSISVCHNKGKWKYLVNNEL